METSAPVAYNPHLKRVLKSYQDAAARNLSGPSSHVAGWGDPSKLSPGDLEEYRKAVMAGTITKQVLSRPMDMESMSSSPPFPVQQMPLLLPMDATRSEKTETVLEDETIACFTVGGEKRLCLPQILNTVLRDFSLAQINSICDDLHIFCSRCNPDQLETLKVTGILPVSAPSCGLITKTDAERLCNALLHGTPEKSKDPLSPNSFKVYHECFGKCKGYFNPDLYVTFSAKCIKCLDCHGMFSPQKFVCHSHKALENRTCHWGFDSANWRYYLLLSKDQEYKARLQEALDVMKAKFDFVSRYKRKQNTDQKDDIKRRRFEENTPPNPWEESMLRGMSAFRPWSPNTINAALKDGKFLASLPAVYGEGFPSVLPSYLQTGPPVLLNPERVVPHSDKNSHDSHFAPNVSLAPASKQQIKLKIKEEITEDEFKSYYRQESTDLDLSSDTEDSSEQSMDSVPTTPGEDLKQPHLLLGSEAYSERKSDLQTLLHFVQGSTGQIPEGRQNLIEELIRLHRRQEEQIQNLTQSKKQLQQELDFVKVSKKERLREASETKKSLRKEIDHLRGDHEARMRDALEDRKKMKRELDHLQCQKNSQINEMKTRYQKKIDCLQGQVKNFEEDSINMKQEIAALREQFKKLGQESGKEYHSSTAEESQESEN